MGARELDWCWKSYGVMAGQAWPDQSDTTGYQQSKALRMSNSRDEGRASCRPVTVPVTRHRRVGQAPPPPSALTSSELTVGHPQASKHRCTTTAI